MPRTRITRFIQQCLILITSLGALTAQAELELFFVHNDHLNTPKYLTDATGKAIWQAKSTPFGEVTEVEDLDGDGKYVTLNMRFPGQYWDHETGTSYNYFRDYDPALGRYVQSDPIGLAGGVNTFGYVGGNPVNLLDLLGLDGVRAGQFALMYVDSGNYGYFRKHPDVGGGKGKYFGGLTTYKCNLFLNDMLGYGGDPLPRMPDGHVPRAAEIQDPNFIIPGYPVLPTYMTPKIGDIVATEGHVGIYYPSYLGAHHTISATGTKGVIWNDWGFRPGQTPTIRRCECDM